MVAVKGNREYKIKDEAAKEKFINEGYDIYDKGKLVAHGKGKKVDITELDKAVRERDTLKAELDKVVKERDTLKAELDKVVKERDALKAELDKFKKDTKEKEQKEK